MKQLHFWSRSIQRTTSFRAVLFIGKPLPRMSAETADAAVLLRVSTAFQQTNRQCNMSS